VRNHIHQGDHDEDTRNRRNNVVVKAQALIECRSNGTVSDCPAGTLDGYTDASTQAAIGKATLIVEEHQNWGKQ
jgi:hypothetical protein